MIDIQYLELLEKILTQGHKKEGRNGGTRSIFSAQIEHDMKEGFPLLTTKKMAWHQVRTEFLWMVRGGTDIRWLIKNNNMIWVGDCYKNYLDYCKERDYYLDVDVFVEEGGRQRVLTYEEFVEKIKTEDNFAFEFADLGPIYGEQYRAADGHLDQLQDSLDMLRSSPESRKNVVNAWNVGDLEDMVLPPCHFAFKFYTRPLKEVERYAWSIEKDGPSGDVRQIYNNNAPKYALSLKWYQRSVDAPLGLPFNIAFYAIMLEVYAEMANMVPEKLIGDLSDVHIYDNQIEGVHTQLDRNPIECQPKLVFPEHIEFGKSIDDFVESVEPEYFQIKEYKSRGIIKFPLSN